MKPFFQVLAYSLGIVACPVLTRCCICCQVGRD